MYRLDTDNQPDEQVHGPLRPKKKQKNEVRTEIEEVLSHPAFSWTREVMCEKVTEDVDVAVTPDGRADSLYTVPVPVPRPRARQTSSRESGRLNVNDESGGEQDREEEDETDLEEVFVQPATKTMSLSSLFDKLMVSPSNEDNSDDDYDDDKDSSSLNPYRFKKGRTRTRTRRRRRRMIYYLQSQNSNLTTTPLSPLLSDLPRHLPFARPVLGDPEAVNIWIGASESVTCTHRDPYENLYLVLRGCKKFTLYPPVEELCLYAKKVRTGRHVLDRNDEFEIVLDDDDDKDDDTHAPPLPSDNDVQDEDEGKGKSEGDDDDDDGGKIPWIPIDPDTIDLVPPDTMASKYPYYRYSHPVTVTVWEGEILYLPSGWFHHVRQECGVWDDGEVAPCIAVNYWYDMDYEGEKYATREMLTRLVEAVRRDQR